MILIKQCTFCNTVAEKNTTVCHFGVRAFGWLGLDEAVCMGLGSLLVHGLTRGRLRVELEWWVGLLNQGDKYLGGW